MPDLSKISDEELMSIAGSSPNTGSSSFQGGSQVDVESLSDEELSQIAFGNITPSFFGGNEAVGNLDAQSPLSLSDRARLSFADESGRYQYLKNKFKYVQQLPNGKYAVGSSPKDMRPIDPEGMFNDVLGDLADVVSEIPVLAGQIAGATSGALGTGGLATVAGGALGAAAGETAKVGIGKALGVRKGDPLEQLTDVAISGMFGGVGEGLGQGLKFAGKGLSGLAKNSFDRAVAQSENPSKVLQMLGKTFKLTAAVPEEDVVEAGLYGFNNSLSSKYMNENYSRELMTKFAKGVMIRNNALGKMVGVGDNWAVNNFGGSSVPIKESSEKLISTLSNPRIGIIDEFYRINKDVLVEPTDRKAIQSIVDSLFNKSTVTGGYYPKNMTVREIIDFKKRSRPLINKYFQSEGVNVDAQRAFAQFYDEITESVAAETSKLAKVPISNNPYVKANKAFSEWKKDLELLKANGLDIEDVSDLKDLFRDGKIVSSRLENFFERFKIKNSSSQQAFSQVASKLPVKFAGGGIGGSVGTLTDELRKYNAAQGFKNANPNFIRMASLTGMVGLNLGREDPKSAAITGGLGLLFGTPAGVRHLLKGGEKIAQGAIRSTISSLKKSGRKVPAATQRAILSRLLSLAASQGNRS